MRTALQSLQKLLQIGWIVVLVAILISGVPAIAQNSPESNPPAPEAPAPEAPVTLDDRTLFVIRDRSATASIKQRAQRISSRIQDVARNTSIPPDALRVANQGEVSIIYAEDIAITTVSDGDAKAANLPRQTLANQYLQTIKTAIEQYRDVRSASHLTWAIVATFLSTVALSVILLILRNMMWRLHRWLDTEQDHWLPYVRLQNLELLSAQQISALLQVFTRILQAIAVVGLLYVYLTFVLSFFPQTRQLGVNLFSNIQRVLLAMVQAFLGYLPNLIQISLIILLTHYLLRFLKLIANSIGRRTLTLPRFYPEWAEPTYRLLSFLIIALAGAVIFPYLPGSNSPAFQGISIFLGVLVSVGSSGIIANTVAGFALVYTRAFQIGDRIQMNDVAGFVEDKLLLVTRIRTLNNTIVTIPNSTLLSNNIINYSALLRDSQAPVILHTTVTLGYDISWRQIHSILIAAALATADILPEPSPFVLQTALNDFYVNYELKAYTLHPDKMERIYSELHQNIQDKCNEAGIEICSPHYTALRDGNQTTIPGHYLPGDYSAPGFRIDSSSNSNSSLSSSKAHSDRETAEKTAEKKG